MFALSASFFAPLALALAPLVPDGRVGPSADRLSEFTSGPWPCGNLLVGMILVEDGPGDSGSGRPCCARSLPGTLRYRVPATWLHALCAPDGSRFLIAEGGSRWPVADEGNPLGDRIRMFEAATGEELWRATLPGPLLDWWWTDEAPAGLVRLRQGRAGYGTQRIALGPHAGEVVASPGMGRAVWRVEDGPMAIGDARIWGYDPDQLPGCLAGLGGCRVSEWGVSLWEDRAQPEAHRPLAYCRPDRGASIVRTGQWLIAEPCVWRFDDGTLLNRHVSVGADGGWLYSGGVNRFERRSGAGRPAREHHRALFVPDGAPALEWGSGLALWERGEEAPRWHREAVEHAFDRVGLQGNHAWTHWRHAPLVVYDRATGATVDVLPRVSVIPFGEVTLLGRHGLWTPWTGQAPPQLPPTIDPRTLVAGPYGRSDDAIVDLAQRRIVARLEGLRQVAAGPGGPVALAAAPGDSVRALWFDRSGQRLRRSGRMPEDGTSLLENGILATRGRDVAEGATIQLQTHDRRIRHTLPFEADLSRLAVSSDGSVVLAPGERSNGIVAITSEGIAPVAPEPSWGRGHHAVSPTVVTAWSWTVAGRCGSSTRAGPTARPLWTSVRTSTTAPTRR